MAAQTAELRVAIRNSFARFARQKIYSHQYP